MKQSLTGPDPCLIHQLTLNGRDATLYTVNIISISAIEQKSRYICWLQQCFPLVSHFEYMPDEMDRDRWRDRQTPD